MLNFIKSILNTKKTKEENDESSVIKLINYEGMRFSVPNNVKDVTINIAEENFHNIIASIETIYNSFDYCDLIYEVRKYNSNYNIQNLSALINHVDSGIHILNDIILSKYDIMINGDCCMKLDRDELNELTNIYHYICLFIKNLYKFISLSEKSITIVSNITNNKIFDRLEYLLRHLLNSINSLDKEMINGYTSPDMFLK